MKNIDLSLLIFALAIILWAGDFLSKSIQALKNKNGILFTHEKLMISFLGILFGKKYSEEIQKRQLNSKRWKWKSIVGLLGGLLFLYIGIDFLLSALW